MALSGLFCADVSLRYYSLTHSLTHSLAGMLCLTRTNTGISPVRVTPHTITRSALCRWSFTMTDLTDKTSFASQTPWNCVNEAHGAESALTSPNTTAGVGGCRHNSSNIPFLWRRKIDRAYSDCFECSNSDSGGLKAGSIGLRGVASFTMRAEPPW